MAFQNNGKLKLLIIVGTPGGSGVKNRSVNARDAGLIPEPGGSHMPWSN